MSLGGGQFTTFDKEMIGVYNRSIVIGGAGSSSTSGTVAIVTPLDFGQDLNRITRGELRENAMVYTGHDYNDPENVIIREAMDKAGTVLLSRVGGGERAKCEGVGEAKTAGESGNLIRVSVLNNVNDSDYFDVSTYFNKALVETQTVPGAKGTQVVLKEKSVTDGDTDGITVGASFNGDTLHVTFTGVERSEINYQIKLGKVIVATEEGKIDVTENEGSLDFTFSPTAPNKADYTILINKEGKNLKTITLSISIEETEENVGADGSLLTDNGVVSFSGGVIAPNAGYEFAGGSSDETITVGDYMTALNRLGGRSFNVLICDSEDEDVKKVFTEFTRRSREDQGIYFQLVSFRNLADNEGVVSVYNEVEGDRPAALVGWVGGAMAGIDLSTELTNVRYTGELQVKADLTQAQLLQLDKQGYFLFHSFGEDEIRTFVDINTKTSFTDEKQPAIKNNQVVRVVDGIYNALNSTLASDYVGKVKNNPLGRGKIWSLVDDTLDVFVKGGVIEPLEDKGEQIQVNPVDGDPYGILILIAVTIASTGRRIYIGVDVTYSETE